MNFKPILILSFILVLLTGITLYYYFDIKTNFSLERIVPIYLSILNEIKNNLFLYSMIYAIIYSIVVTLSIPIASTLTILGGLVFGWYSVILVVTSATLGATLIFIFVKKTSNYLLKEKVSEFTKKLENGFKKNDFLYLFSLRLIPVIPFWVLNIVPGFLNMNVKNFIFATFLGITPGTIVYVWLSTNLAKIVERTESYDLSIFRDPYIMLPLSLIGILILFTTVIKNKIL